MATTVYEWDTISLVDGTIVEISPLKIKYLREFMDIFNFVKTAISDDEAVMWLSECARVCMKQFYPSIQTIEDLEDNLDLPTVYRVLDVAAGIKVSDQSEEPVKTQATESGDSWEDMDLAELESEVFLLGIWKDYNELELSLSMPELIATLTQKREMDYRDKKFLAAMQGVDLDEETGQSDQNAWEEMKARVLSGGKASNSKDIVALQGFEAQQAGFGIGLGLDYVDMR